MRQPFRGNDLANKAAFELGYITKEWASIERSLNEFITLLTPLEEGSISHIVIGNMDLRSKVQALKGLAYLRGFDQDWLDDMIFMLDHIDNDLRVRRNDVVHAEWFSPPRRLLRRTHKTKLLRPQARQLVLETQQNIPVKLNDLKGLTRDLQQAWLATLPLFFFYERQGWEVHRPCNIADHILQTISSLGRTWKSGKTDSCKAATPAEIISGVKAQVAFRERVPSDSWIAD